MKIIGHRGAKGLAPENTLASFKKALEHHVDEIEFDVRITKDGIPVLSHDVTVGDAAGDHLVIKDATYRELLAHKPDLTTLESALIYIEAQVPLVIEVKPHEPLEPIIAVLDEFFASGMYHARNVALGSFSQQTLLALHRTYPEIQMIVIENWSGVRASWRARQLGTKRIQMLEYWLWTGFVRPVTRRGYELYSFPPKKDRKLAKLLLGEHSNNPAKVRAWAKAGLTGVITDYPDRFEK